MAGEPNAADGQNAKFTVDSAAKEFLSLLTPPEPEKPQEPVETPAPDAESTSPEEPVQAADAEQPDETVEAAPAETEAEPEEGSGDQRPVEQMKRDLLADYTKKTQAVAELRKAAEAEQAKAQAAEADARSVRQQYADRLKLAEKMLADLQPAEPDAATLDDLRKTNPSEYAAQVADLQRQRDRLHALRAEREAVEAQEAEARATDFQKRIVTEREKLFQAIPEWKDPKKAEAANRELYSTAEQYGFTTADIAAGMYDHRIVLLLRDAMQYRALKAKVPDTKKKVEALKTATPGGQKTPEPGKAEKLAFDRLTKSGRKDDAAALFLARELKKA
jgi:small-conductance mechanosensitive channel